MLLVDNGDGEIALSGTRNSYVLFSTQHTSPIDVVFSGHRCTTPKSSSAIHSAASTSSTLPAQVFFCLLLSFSLPLAYFIPRSCNLRL
ncbi:hypothetical protein SDJN03_13503, partial [Cucurbita argyrosperma subsp. sororia]